MGTQATQSSSRWAGSETSEKSLFSDSSHLMLAVPFQKQPRMGMKFGWALCILPCSSHHVRGDQTCIKLTRNLPESLWYRAGKAQTSQGSLQTVTRHSWLPQLSPHSVITICRTTEIRFLEFLTGDSLCCQCAGSSAVTLERRESFMVLVLHTSPT